LAYTQQGRNVNLDIKRVVGYRHFCNKVWNATRFGLRYFGADFKFSGALRLDAPFAWEDRWILSRLSSCAGKVNQAMEKYEFAGATTATYQFFLYELCDVYLELLKPRFYGEGAEAETPAVAEDRQVAREVLYICLDWSMRLMHPLLPYLTEELYHRLPPSPTKCRSITIAPYPTTVNGWINEGVEGEMEVLSEVAKQFRSQKTSLGFAPSARPAGFVRHATADTRATLARLTTRLSRMGQIGEVKVLPEGSGTPAGTLQNVVNADCLVYLEVAGLDLTKELDKLLKKVSSAEKTIKSYEDKLALPQDKIPQNVREMNAQKLEAAKLELQELERAVASIRQAIK